VFNTSTQEFTFYNTSTTTIFSTTTVFSTSRSTGTSRATGTSRSTGTSRFTSKETSRNTTYNTSRNTTFNTARNTTISTTYATEFATSTSTTFNTTYVTTFNTTASLQTRYRTSSVFKAIFACDNTTSIQVYRLVNNNSSAVVTVNDNLYTNSSGTSALASGNYGISTSFFGSASVVATVGTGGLVTAVLSCGGGPGDGPGGGGGPQF
tara:strand:+ start:848 stop:1471 length:624 start_codon:yes stop_codon:yes gene_type:complete